MADASLERFDGYEAEIKLVEADLSQKLDQIAELSGEERKAALKQAESSLDEARELGQKAEINKRLRNHESDVDAFGRKVQSLSSDKAKLFGSRYRDEPEGGDDHLDQRQQLLSGTERLTRSSGRLTEAQRIANETENIGAGVLRDLAGQREVIINTRDTLGQAEGYTDRSLKTLRGMARRMATNRIITISIITILVILIIAVIVSKFR